MYFRHYGLPKTRLDKYKKETFPSTLQTSNMVNALKHCSNLHVARLPYSSITAKDFEFQKVTLSDMQNLKTAS